MENFTLESPLSKSFGFALLAAENLENLTLPEYLLQKARLWSQTIATKPYIIDAGTGESHDFGSFEEKTRKLASALYKQGMRENDTAIYMTSDMVNLHIFFAGVWRANGAVRASYPEDDEETLLFRVKESKVGWILCDPGAVEMCLSVAKKITSWRVQVIVVGAVGKESGDVGEESGDVSEESGDVGEESGSGGCISLRSLFEDEGDAIPPLLITPQSIAMILCTSGTTGRSKGAVHTHKNLLAMVEGMNRFFPFASEKPNLVVSKATHIMGSVFPLVTFAGGKQIIVVATISKQIVFKAVDFYKPGVVWGFPTFLLAFVNDAEAKDYDFSSIEIAASGGAAVTPAIERTLMTLPNLKFVLIVYGMTEIVPIALCANYESKKLEKYPDSPPSTSGKVFPGASIQIRDPKNPNLTLGPNQSGEIYVKSPALFTEYYKNVEATNEAIVNGWFRTGDIGRYDENGFLFVGDRLKEIFKYFNNHISPTELEEVIAQHPSVAESCVIGIDDPNGGGSIPKAYVILKNDDGLNPVSCSAKTAVEICNFANGKLAAYKHLRGGVVVLKELPKGKTGKITRQLVEKLEAAAKD